MKMKTLTGQLHENVGTRILPFVNLLPIFFFLLATTTKCSLFISQSILKVWVQNSERFQRYDDKYQTKWHQDTPGYLHFHTLKINCGECINIFYIKCTDP